jgi:hypothetical protein
MELKDRSKDAEIKNASILVSFFNARYAFALCIRSPGSIIGSFLVKIKNV